MENGDPPQNYLGSLNYFYVILSCLYFLICWTISIFHVEHYIYYQYLLFATLVSFDELGPLAFFAFVGFVCIPWAVLSTLLFAFCYLHIGFLFNRWARCLSLHSSALRTSSNFVISAMLLNFFELPLITNFRNSTTHKFIYATWLSKYHISFL